MEGISFQDLPEEITTFIFSLLSTRDLCSIGCVCQTFNCVTDDDMMWKTAFEGSPLGRVSMVQPSCTHNQQTYKYLCCHSVECETIGEAVAVAKRGATIYVRPGYYAENLFIDKYVSIIGISGEASSIIIESKLESTHVLKIGIVSSTASVVATATLVQPSTPQQHEGEEEDEWHSPVGKHGDEAEDVTCNTFVVRNCHLRQKHSEPLYFCVNIVSGRVLIENSVIYSDGLSCICIQRTAVAIIRQNTISGTSAGLSLFDCSRDTIVEDNIIHGNHYSAVEISANADPVIRNNSIHGGLSAGVFVYDDGKGLIENNAIYDNGASGVEIARGSTPVLRRNRIYNGKGCGVSIYENAKGLLEENEIFDNFDSNIYISRNANPLLRRNKIFRARLSGVYIHNSGLGTLEENEIYENMHEGVATIDQSNPKLTGNIIRDNKRAGVVVYAHGAGSFEKNVIVNNVGGIEVRRMGRPLLVDNNVLNDNELVSQELQDCIARGRCTYTVTGINFHPQYWWYCDTCENGGDKGCCAVCVQTCHKDHKVSHRRFSLFYCDCGAEWNCSAAGDNKKKLVLL